MIYSNQFDGEAELMDLSEISGSGYWFMSAAASPGESIEGAELGIQIFVGLVESGADSIPLNHKN